MDKTLPCEIINDLLPTYADGLTNEVTTLAIQLHLEHCQDCTNVLQNMKVSENRADHTKDIDYLKKVRTQTHRSIAIAVTLCIFIALGTYAGIFIWRALIGVEAAPYDMDYFMSVEDKVLKVQGSLISNYYGQENTYSKIRFEEIGNAVVIRIGRVVKSRFHDDSYFEAEYEAGENIKKVYVAVGDRMFVAYERGVNISPGAAIIADTVIDGKFDMGREWQVKAGIQYWLDIDKREFQVAYDNLDNPSKIVIGMNALQKQEVFDRKMNAIAYVLLAIFDHCESVSWVYGVPDDWAGNKTDYEDMITITRHAASDSLNKDIRSYGNNAVELQELMLSVY